MFENQPINTIIGTIQSIDQDTVTDLTFELIEDANGAFKLDDKIICQNISNNSNGKLMIFFSFGCPSLIKV